MEYRDRNKTKFTKDLLSEHAHKCRTLRQFLTSIGGSTTSMSSRAYVKRQCKIFGIDLSHFVVDSNNGGKQPTRKSSSEILVYNRRNGLREATYKLRRALKDEGVKEVCECGQDDNWKGRKLILEIDHIDGDCLNNQLYNLRFICPNCHSQVKINYKK